VYSQPALEPEHAELLSSFRLENRPYFDDFTREPFASLYCDAKRYSKNLVASSSVPKVKLSYRLCRKYKEARRSASPSSREILHCSGGFYSKLQDVTRAM
jgi:hypothetical protein